MSTLNATEARSKLYALIDETNETHKPILITGKRGNAELLAGHQRLAGVLATHCGARLPFGGQDF